MSSPVNILITGANGQLGMEFRSLQNKFPEINFTFAGRDELSISNMSAMKEFFVSHSFDHCINCAAYTAVDKAEEEIELAENINGHAVGDLAAICYYNKVKLIHISTDYVFDGNAHVAYKEDDRLSPVNEYGRSKLLGEALALNNNPDTIVIRTSWVYSEYGKNFVKTMLRLMNEKESISVVSGQQGSPTYAADLAGSIISIIKKQKFVPGVYHFCNEGVISWFDFAEAIRDISGLKCIVNPIPTSSYPTPAKRPAFSALDTSKIKATFGITIPKWKDSLQECLSKISH